MLRLMADLQRGVSMDLRRAASELREENRALRAEARQVADRASQSRRRPPVG
jgi:hypothetical protein